MGHNSVVSGHPKYTGIPWVDGLSTGPPNLGRHSLGKRLPKELECGYPQVIPKISTAW